MTDPDSTQVSCLRIAMASVSHLSLILGAPSSLFTAWVSQGLAQIMSQVFWYKFHVGGLWLYLSSHIEVIEVLRPCHLIYN